MILDEDAIGKEDGIRLDSEDFRRIRMKGLSIFISGLCCIGLALLICFLAGTPRRSDDYIFFILGCGGGILGGAYLCFIGSGVFRLQENNFVEKLINVHRRLGYFWLLFIFYIFMFFMVAFLMV